MKIAILGAGESGLGAALLGKHIGAEVWLSDKGQIADQIKETLSTEHIAFEEGRHTETSFFDADVIVKSPGIPDTVPLLQRLRAAGKPIISEIEFASRYTRARIIAITGSNGKTTTTSLIGHLMASAGRSATVAGNIGPSFARKVVESQPD
ncbi:MAG: Mur ligase family protein, partial [Bacteroidota bacterium]